MEGVPGARTWQGARRSGRPRVLVESTDPALAISDFSRYGDAGFDVAFCPGPEEGGAPCPLLDGEDCELLAGADVVLHGLDPRLGLVAAIRRRHPETAVVVEHRRGDDSAQGAADSTVLAFPCSVAHQVDTLRAALPAHRRPADPRP